jgi:hypothetical protein
MFCSVQEAWPEYYNYKNNDKNNVYNDNRVDNYKKPYINQSIGANPHLKSQKRDQEIKKTNTKIEHFNDDQIEEFNEEYFNNECEQIMQHIEYCNKCKQKLNIMKNNNSLINKINNISEETKETVIIFLIGFIVILLIHLFHK